MLITFILFRPATVAGLRGAWPLRPLGRQAVRSKGRRALMSLHYPDMVRSCGNLASLG